MRRRTSINYWSASRIAGWRLVYAAGANEAVRVISRQGIDRNSLSGVCGMDEPIAAYIYPNVRDTGTAGMEEKNISGAKVFVVNLLSDVGLLTRGAGEMMAKLGVNITYKTGTVEATACCAAPDIRGTAISASDLNSHG
ncbi:MAG TPA: hypothetical protein VFJ58_04995 [Armatimonadota bacterium]|nr:hypothetical protein [Armatimonadota bacterium]